MVQDRDRRLTLRERTRDAVREQVRREALALFAEQGFDATTADDVAAAVGISARSFFRYFPTKEDVLTGGTAEWGGHVRDALAARPADEPIGRSLRAAFDPVVAATTDDPAYGLTMKRVVMSTPALRAHHFEKHLLWEQLLIPVVERRLDGPDDGRALRAQTLAHTALACLDVALSEWVARDGTADLGDLLDTVYGHVAL